MKYKLIFAPEFIKDLDDIFIYISRSLDAPIAAKKQMSDIDKVIIKLKTMPFMYPLCDEPLNELNYRKIVVSNYILIYVANEKKKCVNLLRAFYGKREYYKFFRVE